MTVNHNPLGVPLSRSGLLIIFIFISSTRFRALLEIKKNFLIFVSFFCLLLGLVRLNKNNKKLLLLLLLFLSVSKTKRRRKKNVRKERGPPRDHTHRGHTHRVLYNFFPSPLVFCMAVFFFLSAFSVIVSLFGWALSPLEQQTSSSASSFSHFDDFGASSTARLLFAQLQKWGIVKSEMFTRRGQHHRDFHDSSLLALPFFSVAVDWPR